MTAHLRERLAGLVVDEAREAGGLQVFGLRWEGGGPDYVTLDEGLASGQLAVTEVTEGGSVPTLKVQNRGDTLGFLMAGEQLCGGKQNRVLNASVLVPAKSELPIPVSCVERGRWAYRSAHFGSAGSSSHSALRKMMHCHATESYRREGRPSSKQGEVWQEVDRKLSQTRSDSPTRVLQEAYVSSEEGMSAAIAQLPAPEGACGAVFAYGGKVIGFDLFDRPATLAKLWPKLVRAYAIDAFTATPAQAVSRADVVAWLAAATAAKEEVFKSPGVGNDVRLESTALVGAGLVIEDRPVHVEVFSQMGA